MLTKAEILWTRKCPLTCSYCAMIDYDFEKAPLSKMLEGVDQLQKHGCGFFAIYGSSPLYGEEFNGLDTFIHHTESVGILTTVIVDGIDKETKPKLQQLYKAGLRSLTCSWDGESVRDHLYSKRLPIHVDKQTRLKSEKGIELVKWFRASHDDLRDVELVTTVTKKNWEHVLTSLELDLLPAGIWFSFDFIHPDRGQPGTKAKGTGKGLAFENNDLDRGDVIRFCEHLLDFKQRLGFVHQSEEYLRAVIAKPEIVTCMKWKCTGPTFPSWVTIDADGTVLPCDDFWTDRTFKVWDFDEAALKVFSREYAEEVKKWCPGCAWSTHWDAVRIAESGKGFNNYVHIGG